GRPLHVTLGSTRPRRDPPCRRLAVRRPGNNMRCHLPCRLEMVALAIGLLGTEAAWAQIPVLYYTPPLYYPGQQQRFGPRQPYAPPPSPVFGPHVFSGFTPMPAVPLSASPVFNPYLNPVFNPNMAVPELNNPGGFATDGTPALPNTWPNNGSYS